MSDGLAGLFVRAVAKRRERLGAEMYWGMICGIVIFLPTAVLWGFYLSIGVAKMAGYFMETGANRTPLSESFAVLLIDAAFIALVIIAGGLAGGLAGMLLKSILKITKLNDYIAK